VTCVNYGAERLTAPAGAACSVSDQVMLQIAVPRNADVDAIGAVLPAQSSIKNRQSKILKSFRLALSRL
jgi:hypothetical protein